MRSGTSWATRSRGSRRRPRLSRGAALGVLGADYVLFAVGWWRLLAAFRIRVSYGTALQAEMVPCSPSTSRAGSGRRSRDRLAAPGRRRAGHVLRRQLDPARGGALGGCRHPGLHCGARRGGRGRGAARAAFRVRDRDGGPAAPAGLHGDRARRLPPLRRPEPPRLPYRILSACSATTHSRGRRRPALYLLLRSLDADPGSRHPVPGRGCRGGGDRRRPHRVRALGPRRPRGVDVRPARRRRALETRRRCHRANRLAITLVEAALLGGRCRLRRGATSPGER